MRLGPLTEQWFAGEKADPAELLELGKAMEGYPDLRDVLRGAQQRMEMPEAREGINAILARAVSAREG